jgi:hypothetical protein
MMADKKRLYRRRKPTAASGGDVDRGTTPPQIDESGDKEIFGDDGIAVIENYDNGVDPQDALLEKHRAPAKPTAKQRDADAVMAGTLKPEELEGKSSGDVKALRWWGQISYPYETDPKGTYPGMSEVDWRKSILDRLTKFAESYCAQLAFIFHDKDVVWEEDKSKNRAVAVPKPLHMHFEFVAKNRQPRNRHSVLLALKKAGLIISRDENLSWVQNWASTTQYLIHISEGAMMDRKHVYPVSDVHVWLRDEKSKSGVPIGWLDAKSADDWMQDNLFGNGAADMRHATGLPDTVLFYSRMVACGAMTVDDVRDELLVDARATGIKPTQRPAVLAACAEAAKSYSKALGEYFLEHGRQLVTVYVHGAGNSGKTKLAEKLAAIAAKGLVPYGCNDGGVHKGTSGGKTTMDPFQGYTNESAVVFDEFNLVKYGPETFLETFSPTTVPVVPRRNSNCLWFSTWAFLANSISVERCMALGFDELAKEQKVAQNAASKSDRSDWTGKDYRSLAFDDPQIGDKLYQLHRRIALDIELHDDGSADVYARSDAASKVHAVYDAVRTTASLASMLPDLAMAIDSGRCVVRYNKRGKDKHDLYVLAKTGAYLIRMCMHDANHGVNVDYVDIYNDWGVDARRIATCRTVYLTFDKRTDGEQLAVSILQQMMHHPSGSASFTSVAPAQSPGPRYDFVGHIDDAHNNVRALFDLLRKAEQYYYDINGYPRINQQRPVFCPVHLAPYMWRNCRLCGTDAKAVAVNVDAVDADVSNVSNVKGTEL